MARKITVINIHKGIAFRGNLAETCEFIGVSEPTLNKHLGMSPVFGIGQYIVAEPQEFKDRNFNDFNKTKIEL